MLIQEVAERLGVHQGTIRNWERKGLIESPKRDRINRRVFTEKDLKKLFKFIEGEPSEGN
jgi:excisionase family DNA binding protein